MKVMVKKKPKVSGKGHYYVVIAKGDKGLSGLFGKFSSKTKADKRKLEVERKYGVP